MAVTLSQEDNAYLDGLGKSSDLGLCFLRRVRVTHTNPDTVATIEREDLGGVQKIVRVLGIVPHSAHTVYVSDLADDEVELTASADTAVYDVYLLVLGL